MSAYAVWKFQLEPDFGSRDLYDNLLVEVEMPGVPNVLTAATQDGSICVWAGVDPDGVRAIQRFIVVPTGSQYGQTGPAAFDSVYVGTAFMSGLVFHVFHMI